MGKGSSVCSDSDFVELLERFGNQKTADILGLKIRGIYARRARLEKALGRQITVPEQRHGSGTRHHVAHPHRIHLEIENGIAIVGSDAHYWPGPPSTAHRAFVKFIHENAPALVCLNGDVIDATTISRHPPIGWENTPTLVEEIETAQDRLDEICKACTKKTKKTWTLGNHDGRFETRLATVAPEFARLHGVHLKDHFPLWEPAWSTWINESVVIKHRYKGGLHAPTNNTLYAGKSIITGHLHSAQVRPFNDYNGTRYGVDTGCLADTDAKAFVDYTEDNPKNWRAGFGILTFVNGKLLQPELVLVWDADHVQFRGKIIRV